MNGSQASLSQTMTSQAVDLADHILLQDQARENMQAGVSKIGSKVDALKLLEDSLAGCVLSMFEASWSYSSSIEIYRPANDNCSIHCARLPNKMR